MTETGNELSLVGCMKEIPDPRAPYNQMHKFLDIIIIAVTAILCGMDTWNEIEDWAYSKKEWLETFLELPGGIPSHDTINRGFQMIDPDQFHDAFFRWTSAVAGKIEGIIAIDGKTIRRSKDESKGNRPSHVVSAWACDTSLVLGQLRVDEKTNEIKAIPQLLEILCLKGCVVTIDAMGTQKEIAEKIIDKEADYILQVKGNQETLLEDISLYFKDEVFDRPKKELEKEGRYWVLDIGFREDESRMRAGNAAENVIVLRHIGTNLLKQEKSCRMGIASKRKKCGYDQKYLYKVLSGLNTGMK